MTIPWSKDYSVGVESLDKQHQEIFALVNDFMKMGSVEKVKLEEVINLLQNYGNRHFALEESVFMKLEDYKDKDFHLMEHKKYKDHINDLQNRVERSSDEELFDEIKNFLEKWWVHHVLDVDKLYAVYIEREKNK